MSAAGPLFPEDTSPRIPWKLLGWIGISLFAHVATFFLFQVIYPQRVTQPAPGPQVTLLSPDTPEQEALLRWVAAEDPALVGTSTGAEPPGLLESSYRPSYATLRTPPRTLAPETPPPPQPPSPLAPTFGIPELELPPVAPAGRRPATIHLAGGLSGRTVRPRGPLPAGARLPLQPVEVLLALTAEGEPRFLFLQRSSGEEAADAAAAAWLQTAEYSPGAEALTWGMATVEWGDEGYAAAPGHTP